MASEQLHLEDAKKLYRKAVEEFEIAREKNDRIFLCDACAKGWLSAIEATYALVVKKGVKEEELHRTDWGRRRMVYRYVEKELEWLYFSLRDNLHIECYYERSLDFDEVQIQLNDLRYYIDEVEELKEVRR